MEPQLQMLSVGAGLEWHAFIGTRQGDFRLVGRVEAVSQEHITLTRIDPGAGSGLDAELCVPWDDVRCIAVCGPDRDQDLLALLNAEPNV